MLESFESKNPQKLILRRKDSKMSGYYLNKKVNICTKEQKKKVLCIIFARNNRESCRTLFNETKIMPFPLVEHESNIIICEGKSKNFLIASLGGQPLSRLFAVGLRLYEATSLSW